ncbi:autophagy-related protein 18f-like isoform X2 [Asparagus officinalis]|uniref:autophagy-related protein 18f-like isoform X2 n=1 Tax=Asparagus officinalis TaxID=4686 RepID=UPI00098E3C50|nr:autophagy-related protein 18f-like isoform X2 [Asparagus officinalis]
MRNEGQRPQGSGRNNGFMRSFSSYLRIVSNGASNVASTVKSAGVSVASSLADRDEDAARDQVFWAGFDKLESQDGVPRQVLLLAYRSGFQVWDVEDADDVRQLVSRHDGPVSFLQMLKKPVARKRSEDKFSDVRPLLVVAGDVSLSGNNNNSDGGTFPSNESAGFTQELGNDNSLPTFVHFYSLKVHDYVHVLKFRTAVYSVRCSPRIIAISQAAQIHCFDAETLEREYTILTCPIVWGSPGSGGIGYGPLAVGPRWFAYSGTSVIVSNTSRVSPQHLTTTSGLSQSYSNGSLVAHYAKESSKQLAAGIVTLGDIGYKKLSKYCSEFVADNNGYVKNGSSSLKANGTINSHVPDIDNVGMVIIRDIVLKSVIVQFRAHRSPISALCFDPSGTLLVTASINGHNINVFRIMPSPQCSSSHIGAMGNCIHLYRLQRGITNAVIQDISFSDDSQWIMISSSRGTSHLFSVSPSGGFLNLQVSDANLINGSNAPDLTLKTGPQNSVPSKANSQNLLYPSGNPITLSAVSRIRNGNGWKGAVSGAAAAATGRVSPLSGAIASVFHNCKSSGLYQDFNSLRTKYHLLVFSPSGSIIQYVLRQLSGKDSGMDITGLGTVSSGLSQECDSRIVVEPLQKWDVCHKRNRRDRVDYLDVYGEHGNGESSKVTQKGVKRGTSIYPTDKGSDAKVKDSVEENHHKYISEAELHMHSAQVPLWAKPEKWVANAPEIWNF